MIHFSLAFSERVETVLEAKVKDAGFADVADYVRALIEEDIGVDEDWEMTPELAAALEAGERSGISPRTLDEIFAEARAQYDAGSR